MTHFDETWANQIQLFCDTYNIPHQYLLEILQDPKVMPMIRGKAFEFSALQRLQHLLPLEDFGVYKKVTNPQLGIHDEDLTIDVLSTQNTFKIECKLAKKGSYRYDKTTKEHRILVKCMRSRTLGIEVQKRLAPRYGIDVIQLSIHNDQYRLGEFDVVVTSLANAFYSTTTTKGFEWQPTSNGIEFLFQLGIHPENRQQLAFEKCILRLHQIYYRIWVLPLFNAHEKSVNN
jgi:hypothetical protein